MEIAIIGAGKMAKGIGTRIIAGRHQLGVYDRDLEKAEDLARQLGGNAKGMGLDKPISGEVIILALPYEAIPEVITEHKQELAGKVVVDISNPIDFQTFKLIPPVGSSGAEEISKLLPADTQLVKAFNLNFSGTLVSGMVGGQKLDVWIATNEAETGKMMVKLVEDGGARGIYVGPLEKARILEGMQLIHMSLQKELGTNWMSGIKILA